MNIYGGKKAKKKRTAIRASLDLQCKGSPIYGVISTL